MFWQILVLLAILASTSFAAPTKKVLVILSGEHTLKLKDAKTFETGFYLNEFAVPAQALMDAGYTLTVATPNGSAPSLDAGSDSPKYFHGDQSAYQKAKALVGTFNARSLVSISDSELGDYAAVFFPGGHAPMIDLYRSKEVARVLAFFHQHSRTTALICHGPVSLLSVGKPFLYQGYRLTVFSNEEEKVAEAKKLGGEMVFHPETALKEAGAKLEVGVPGSSHVVVDRELITGQNPASDEEFSNALLGKLK